MNKRKVLIGAISNNSEAKKFIYEKGLHETMFPLMAVCEKIQPDDVFVILTKEAKEKTSHLFKEDVMNLTSHTKYHEINIETQGDDITSLWNIFDNVSHIIEDNDDVYLEITGGLRAFPTVLISMVNFVRQMKASVVFKDIYCSQISNDRTTASLYSVMYFIQLNDWAVGIQNYVQYGDARYLLNLVKNEEENSKSYELVKSLQAFSECMDLCLLDDSKKYYRIVNENIHAFFDTLNQSDNRLEQVFVDRKMKSLEQLLKTKFELFDQYPLAGNIEWNRQHNNYQQVYTIIHERTPELLMEYEVIKNEDIDSFKNVKRNNCNRDQFVISDCSVSFVGNATSRMGQQVWEIIQNHYLPIINYHTLCNVVSIKIDNKKIDKDVLEQINNIFERYHDIREYHKNINVIISYYLNKLLKNYKDNKIDELQARVTFHVNETVKKLKSKKVIDNEEVDQYIDELKELVNVLLVMDKNKKDLEEYEKNCLYHENTICNDPQQKQEVQLSQTMIDHLDEFIAFLVDYNEIRDVRNSINHAQALNKRKNAVNKDTYNHDAFKKEDGKNETIKRICAFIKKVYNGSFSDKT